MIPDVHGFRFLYPAAGRSLGRLGQTPAYHLVGPAGAFGNIPPDPNSPDIPVQLRIQQIAGGPVATIAAYASAYAQVTGEPSPVPIPTPEEAAAAMAAAVARGVGIPPGVTSMEDFPTDFVAWWQTYAVPRGHSGTVAVLNGPALPAGAMTPAQYAQLYPQNVGIPISQAAVSQAEAAMVSGQPNQSVPPRDTSVPMPAGTGPTAAHRLVGSYAAANAPPPSLAAPSFLSGGMGTYLLLGLGAVVLFMAVKK